jgi:hypothetical protein
MHQAEFMVVLNFFIFRKSGPISVAIHIQDDESHEQILADLHELYRDNPLMKEYVDLHLIVDKFDRQFNMWRNVAKFFARTEYIVMLGKETRSLSKQSCPL